MNFINFFLQITTDLPETVGIQETATGGSSDEMTLLSLLFKGGYLMIPIILLSAVAVYIFIERWIYIRKAGKLDKDFLHNIREKIEDGNVQGAIEYCQRHPYPIARMIEKGLIRLGSPMRDIESAIEQNATVEISKMEKGTGVLGAIAQVAPMTGFLGTVIGMIKAFHGIAISNNISIGIIAGGIYEKMITSATGLIVGILAYMLLTVLNNKIDETISKMEITATDFLDMLYKPTKG